MLLDMLSTDMYVSYNVKLAHRIGLHTSIYMTELLNINRKAIQKEKLINNSFFKVDRNYIEQRTTLTRKEQKELDEILQNLNIIKIDSTSRDILYIDTNALTGLLLDDRATVETKLRPIVKKKRVTKHDMLVAELRNEITTDNVELRAAYEEWIDAVLARQGWMAKTSVQDAQKLIDTYTDKDLDLAIQIIRVGTANGYRDMSWAINKFETSSRGATPIRRGIPINSNTAAPVRDITFSDEVY